MVLNESFSHQYESDMQYCHVMFHSIAFSQAITLIFNNFGKLLFLKKKQSNKQTSKQKQKQKQTTNNKQTKWSVSNLP